MTKQEIFDLVASSIIKQGKKSYSEVNCLCYYQSPDGCKCAAGFLIPDEIYSVNMENRNIDIVLDGYRFPTWMYEHRDLIYCLQIVHDEADGKDFLNSIKKRLIRAAQEYNLSYALVLEDHQVTTPSDDRFTPSTWGV